MTQVLEGKRLAFIGGGVMGEAMITGLVSRTGLSPGQIIASEPVEARRESLRNGLGIEITAVNREAADGADLLVFAVKPQVLAEVLDSLGEYIAPETVILSIVAGAPIARFVETLGTSAVARVMPNTPAQIGQGASLWTATPETTSEQMAQVREVVRALGVEVYSDSEDHIDMATALSGSGPAYVFLFMEAMTDAGVQMGLSRSVAEVLALHTVLGSAEYARQTALHPAVLRNRVTSPGGTTAAALFELEQGGFRGLMARAIVAAYDRARDLGEAT